MDLFHFDKNLHYVFKSCIRASLRCVVYICTANILSLSLPIEDPRSKLGCVCGCCGVTVKGREWLCGIYDIENEKYENKDMPTN